MNVLYIVAATARPDQVHVPQGNLTGTTLTNALQLMFVLAGAIALAVVTYAGFRYALSRGNPDALVKARETIIYAMVGLLVSITGFGLVSFVFQRI